MRDDLFVKAGPSNYQCRVGVLDELPKLLTELHAKTILIVHGKISWQKARPYLDALYESDIEIHDVFFNGECSYVEVDRLTAIAKEVGADMVVGVGGGKLCDTVKYVGNKADIKITTIPTLASNCAPWTPLSVMYKENGMAEGWFDILPNGMTLMLVEPRLALDAPLNYFIAGIADTLAKWYESDLILSEAHLADEPFLRISRASALACRDFILSDGDQAVADMKVGILSEPFVHMVEVVTAIAGLVGGLGDAYARTTGAHDMHDVLSKLRPEVHDFLHGEKVAYGILFQLALEEKWTVIDELLPFYEKLNLPKTMAELNIKDLTEAEKEAILEELVSENMYMHNLPIPINKQTVKTAIEKLEEYFV